MALNRQYECPTLTTMIVQIKEVLKRMDNESLSREDGRDVIVALLNKYCMTRAQFDQLPLVTGSHWSVDD